MKRYNYISGLFFVFLFSLFLPSASFAAPEAYAFEDFTKSFNVDPTTGDMALSLPMLTIPARGLKYDIILNYNSNINPTQESTWVGFGWNLGVDTISRKVNNIPDDICVGSTVCPTDTSISYKNNYPENYPEYMFAREWANFFATRGNVESQISELESNFWKPIGRNAILDFAGSVHPVTIYNHVRNYHEIQKQASDMREDVAESQEALIQSQEGIKQTIQKYSQTQQFKPLPGMIYSPSYDQDLYNLQDNNKPDSYFVSSKVYSGALSLYQDANLPDKEYFLPTTYQGSLNPSSIEFLDGGYSGDFITDGSIRFNTLIDSTFGGKIDGFELTDLDGNKFLFDEVVEEKVSANLNSFSLSDSSYNPPTNDFVEWTFTNSFSGGLLFDEGSLSSDSNGKLGSSISIEVPYTNAWSISEIISPDYYDLFGVVADNVEGLDETDKGSWIKFNYFEPTFSDGVFTYSNSQNSIDSTNEYLDFNDFSFNSQGNKFVTRGHKKFKYLDNIETPTHFVEFIVSDRQDGKEVFHKTGSLDSKPKLDSIIVYIKRSGELIPFERYNFVYDYSLVSGAPSRTDPGGRLTLTSLEYCVHSEESDWNCLPGISFEYNNQGENLDGDICLGSSGCNEFDRASTCLLAGCTLNSDSSVFIRDAQDRWGNYFISTDVNNFNNHLGVQNDKSDSWVLNKVLWSTGGETKWVYEEDRYSNVNDVPNLIDESVVNFMDIGDTKYGGGIRVKSFENCDGMGNCYNTAYRYTNENNPSSISTYNNLNNEFDGWGDNSISSSLSSGVASGEPPVPQILAYLSRGSKSLDNTQIKSVASGVQYGQVFSYLDDGSSLFPYGVTKSNFYTSKDFPGDGDLILENINSIYDLHNSQGNQDSPSSVDVKIMSELVTLVGGPEINDYSEIEENNDDFNNALQFADYCEGCDKLIIEKEKPYLFMSSNKKGYLILAHWDTLRTNSNSNNCENKLVAIEHPADAIPLISEPCPGDDSEELYCGSIEFDFYARNFNMNGLPYNSDFNDGLYPTSNFGNSFCANTQYSVCECAVHPGRTLLFCPTQEEGGNIADLSQESDWRDYVADNIELGDYTNSQDIQNPPDYTDINLDCYHVFGGANSLNERIYFLSNGYLDVDSSENNENGITSESVSPSCLDNDGDFVCDALENELIKSRTIFPSYKYGLKYYEAQYSSEELVSPILYSQSEFEWDEISTGYNSRNILSGWPKLSKTISFKDGVLTEINYINYEKTTGLLKETEKINSNGVSRSNVITYAMECVSGGWCPEDYQSMRDRHIYSPVFSEVIWDTTNGGSNQVFAKYTRWKDSWGGPQSGQANEFFPDAYLVYSGQGNWYPYEEKIVDFSDDSNSLVNNFIAYDAYGNVVVSEDGLGNRNFYHYGNNEVPCGDSSVEGGLFLEDDINYGSRLTCIENNLGHITKVYTDEKGRVSQDVDVNGKITNYGYDSLGRLDKVALPGFSLDDPNLIHEYGYFTSSTNPNWVKTITKLNEVDELISISYFDGLGRALQTKAELEDGVWYTSESYYNEIGISNITYKSEFKQTNENYTPNLLSVIISKVTYYLDPLMREKEVFMKNE